VCRGLTVTGGQGERERKRTAVVNLVAMRATTRAEWAKTVSSRVVVTASGKPPAVAVALEVAPREGKGAVVPIRLAAMPVKLPVVAHESMTVRYAVVAGMERLIP
jgi:hypothetical protein